MSKGWIKLHRQILENEIWLDRDPFDRRSAWIDLLLMANHKERKLYVNGKIMTVERGQMLTSEVNLSKRWHWTRNRVRRYLAAIEANKMVSVNRTSYGTWINVENYAYFQDRATGNDTAVDTSNDTGNDTGNDTAVDTQTRSIKNVKEDKREGQAPPAFSPPAIDEVAKYCAEKNYKMDPELFVAYYDARDWTLSKGKPMVNWKSAATAWERREKKEDGSRSAEGMNDKQAQLQYERTQAKIKEYEQKGDTPKFKDGVVAEMLRRRSG